MNSRASTIRRTTLGGLLATLLALVCVPCRAASAAGSRAASSWTTELMRVLLLRDYNTRMVVLATALLGFAAGVTGCFLLLRKRSLMGDALSHATLPGIGIAFIAMATLGGTGKWVPGLLLGALATGVLGMLLILAIRRWTMLQDDTALGIVLSVFFGCGIAVLGFIQNMPQGSAAGLESFIYGKPASIVKQDFVLIAATAVVAVVACVALFKEFSILCFDADFAATQGWPVTALDIAILTLVTLVTVVGLQAVGLMLVIAMLIIPAAAARFWTDKLSRMAVISPLIGAASGWLGSSFSALYPNWPAGAVIVVAGALFFVVSMVFGPKRGIVDRAVERVSLSRKVQYQHMLRTVYELLEGGTGEPPEVVEQRSVPLDRLVGARSWSSRRLRHLLRRARRRGDVSALDETVAFTAAGAKRAAAVVRNHRLWEVYLLAHADVAPSHVDRGADRVEHILGPELVNELEQSVEREPGMPALPPSPHPLH